MSIPMPRQFRKKPVVIEAMQFTGTNGAEIEKWTGGEAIVSGPSSPDFKEHLNIATLEGGMEASPGDWVIKGVKGEFYPCKPDIFEATYEPVPETKPFMPLTERDLLREGIALPSAGQHK